MVKLTKEFRGVPNGEIYPVTYKSGDECPEELLAAAIQLEAVDKKVASKIAADAEAARLAQEAADAKAAEEAEAARLAQEAADAKAAEEAEAARLAAEEEAARKAAEGGNA